MRTLFTLILFFSMVLPTFAGGSIKGSVELDPKLIKRVTANDTVFVFAQAPQGPRMPLAIIRAQVKDLPLKFSLDDSMAMVPAMKLSRFSEVNVIARITKGGMAKPQSGDLEGIVTHVRVGQTEKVKVTIATVLP